MTRVAVLSLFLALSACSGDDYQGQYKIHLRGLLLAPQVDDYMMHKPGVIELYRYNGSELQLWRTVDIGQIRYIEVSQ